MYIIHSHAILPAPPYFLFKAVSQTALCNNISILPIRLFLRWYLFLPHYWVWCLAPCNFKAWLLLNSEESGPTLFDKTHARLPLSEVLQKFWTNRLPFSSCYPLHKLLFAHPDTFNTSPMRYTWHPPLIFGLQSSLHWSSPSITLL